MINVEGDSSSLAESHRSYRFSQKFSGHLEGDECQVTQGLLTAYVFAGLVVRQGRASLKHQKETKDSYRRLHDGLKRERKINPSLKLDLKA